MGFGPKLPKGFLPVFSVDTEQDAKDLIGLACPMDAEGHYYAGELAAEQTLENLQKFSDKLARCWKIIQKRKGRLRHAARASSRLRRPHDSR